MKEHKKQYWKGIEQLTEDPHFVAKAEREFPEYLPVGEAAGGDGSEGTTRRDFLKLMGFSVAAATLASCETPVKHAIPYLNKPEDVDPGIANYYASTYSEGGDYCSILVKTREGRPIKIEGNKHCPITRGGTNAQIEASILSLYDQHRLVAPQIKGKKAKWNDVDKQVVAGLKKAAASGKKISIVSHTILSPTTKKVIDEFIAKYPTAEHVVYDAVSYSGMLDANQECFGKRVIPSYKFDQANVIVSFGADFLGTWLSPVEFSKQYSLGRKIGTSRKTMSKHIQFESNLSLTGSNADNRFRIKPSQEGVIVAALYNHIAKKTGAIETISGSGLKDEKLKKAVAFTAEKLLASKGSSIVVSGSNDPAVQTLINGINFALNNYSSTLEMGLPSYYKQGSDQQFNQFVSDAKAGAIGAVIFYNVNPIYNTAKGAELANALKNVSLKVSTNIVKDETLAHVDIAAPDHHYLESWNDAEPIKGHLTLGQPTISPLFKTRQVQESLLAWAGNGTSYLDYLKGNWKSSFYNAQVTTFGFQAFWDKCLHDGIYQHGGMFAALADSVSNMQDVAIGGQVFTPNLSKAASSIAKNYKENKKGTELVLYQKIGIGTGYQSNNPWLQEMPDPITKATWDNYVTISPALAKSWGLKMEEGIFTKKAKLTVGKKSITAPVMVQPGQADDTVGLALGYGQKAAGRVANELGVDAYPLISSINNNQSLAATDQVKIELTSEKHEIAHTQTHHTFMGRKTVIQEATLTEYKKDPGAGRFHPMIATSEGKKKPSEVSLWKGHEYPNHHWGMVIDLNSCTGCSACTIACQAENNVPVVGKKEVIRRREMHWLRIDRYYSSDADENDTTGMEEPSANPEVVFQPMMCQHCNNAPCETVCPVAATTHSTEGLNQMTYNRCVGTRYCANNCPYKVRRFNWFKYHDSDKFPDNLAMNNDLGKMVLNPDVTVRARGVMEKCSMCVQRIQNGKLEAKKQGRKVEDADVNTACASSCPTDAIVFGDMNNPESQISKVLNEEQPERVYHVLEELNVSPNVFYLTKVRNKSKNGKKDA